MKNDIVIDSIGPGQIFVPYGMKIIHIDRVLGIFTLGPDIQWWEEKEHEKLRNSKLFKLVIK